VFLTPYKFFIDQASSVKMAGYWPRCLFATKNVASRARMYFYLREKGTLDERIDLGGKPKFIEKQTGRFSLKRPLCLRQV